MTSPQGILLIDKPSGPTSHTMVARTRRLLGTRKVGHAGTLDPMATGLLVLGVGSATRLLTHLVGADKEYEATIRLGESTVTDDAEGQSLGVADPVRLKTVTDARLAEAVQTLTGTIRQVPSSVSAIKVKGVRAYDRVRSGEQVELAAREITVHGFELLERRDEPRHVEIDVHVTCSSGTYIRALARDLGALLQVGGHLGALRRTRVGPFTVAQACQPDMISVDAVMSPADAASLLIARWQVTRQQAVDLGHGKRVQVSSMSEATYAAIDPDERLVAIVEVSEGTARVVTGFPRHD